MATTAMTIEPLETFEEHDLSALMAMVDECGAGG